jgi:calcineurin-like phosphoesterase family protein
LDRTDPEDHYRPGLRPRIAGGVVKFRDDIDPANTWVVSDTHFGHDNIVGFCHRPEDHEQVMIAEWRKEVPDEPEVTLLHLGDLCYKGNARFKNIVAPELTPRTSRKGKITQGARKLLIMGNHDRQRYSFYKDSGFQVVRPFAINLMEDDASLRLVDPLEASSEFCWCVSFSHYPWSDEDDSRPMRGTDLRIHGHIHNNGYSRDAFVPFIRNHVNISVEQTKYKPINLKLLLDAVLLGEYPETTEEQLQEARDRKEANRA